MNPSREAKRSRGLLSGGNSPKRKAPSAKQVARRQRAASVGSAPKAEARGSHGGRFAVVGIGASAGGLEALEAFLKRVPERCGMAFVVVQHLDPTHKSTIVELLQRATPMPVVEVKESTKVEPEGVYVIPPDRDMSILEGVLHLHPRPEPRGLALSIDHFFRSLAEDQQERGIGVVLSGMGSDGTLGLRAIKEKAGAGFVQAPSSAKFDGMPSSAIEAGLADVVAPVEELPARIVTYLRHAPYVTRPGVVPPQLEKAQSNLEKVFTLLRSRTGNDFSLYKRSTLYRLIERRMGLHQLDKLSSYVRYLRENPKEIEPLFKDLLIGVTSFFRDPAAWERLGQEVTALLAERTGGSVIRAWVPGCSTGEEAYSLAFVFREALERLKKRKRLTLQVFATDLDRDAIEKARQGFYPANIAADVSPDRLRRFFLREENGYRVRGDVREMVIFAPQNLLMDPPFTRLDVLSCRNLLIYLAPEVQDRLLRLFHYSLNPRGILFLGRSETTGASSSIFAPLDGKTHLYRRLETAALPPLELPTSFARPSAHGEPRPGLHLAQRPPDYPALAARVLQRFSPAAILTDEQGAILFTSGRTGKYLEPPLGKVNWNVFAMARAGLSLDLSSAFSAALRRRRAVTVRGVEVATDGDTQAVDLTVQRLDAPNELRGTVMIVILDVPARPAKRGRPRRSGRPNASLAEMESEVQRSREEAQSIREEMLTSQEELKSANEELQSTNEELTSSKEEMQSLNEELQTVNRELQNKVDELSRSNSDMKNLLNSTEVATLFLDDELRVRRFTSQTARLIKLISGDVGRPITDLVSELDYPELAEDAREVLRTLYFKERIVIARGGRWFTVRVMPYRTLEDVIDGLVITFSDASAAKELDTSLREQASQLRQMAESLPTLVWGCRPDGACDYLSRQWLKYTGLPEESQLGYRWLDQVHPDDRERVRKEWKNAVKSGAAFSTDLRIRSGAGAHRWFKTHAVSIRDEHGKVVKWYGTHTDVDDLKQTEEEHRRRSEKVEGVPEEVAVSSE